MKSSLYAKTARALALGALALSACLGYGAKSDASEPKTLFSWDFETQADVDAWGRNCLSKPTAEDGALSADYTDWDPFIVSPQFEFAPKPGQYVEIRMKSTGYYVGEIFYASSNEGPYNGFSQEKTAQWDIVHDGKWHTYQILPAWLAEPQIIKLRIDLGRPTEEEIKDGASVQIDYVRVVDIDIEGAAAAEKTEWNEDELKSLKTDSSVDLEGYESAIGLVDPKKTGSNLYLEFAKPAEFATPFPRANVRVLVGEGSGVVQFQVPLFGIDPVGDRYVRNIDLSAFKEFGAPFYRWEITLPKGCALKNVAFTKAPLGPGVLESQGDGNQVELARLRDGKANVRYEAILRNCGGADLTNFKFAQNGADFAPQSVSLKKIAVDPLLGFNPTGDRLASKAVEGAQDEPAVEFQFSGQADAPKNVDLKPGEAFRVEAIYLAKDAKQVAQSLRIEASSEQNGAKVQTGVVLAQKMNVLPAINVGKMDYPAPPKKIDSPYEIGAFYFPGWSKRSGWDKIDEAAPIRKPLLGYYDEANPEVVDWQIKWAAENGIQFFFVDWYWRHGTVSLDHWVKAFQQAKYRSNLKWAVMWANHTGYGTHSTEDWKNVAKYWIDNYFKTPEYYTIDGKPVVVMWDHSIVDHDMIEEAKQQGEELKPGEGCKRAFEIVRNMAKEAGFPGVYFIAIKWPEHAVDPTTVQKYADAGFDATTIYHFMYPGKGVENSSLYSFDDVANASKPNWDERAKTGILPSIPNISTGWDSRPWHGFRNTVVYGRSVDSFRKILKAFKQYAEETGNKRVVLAPMNEWGEGSYIEPNNEFGFGMYEAIREELCNKPEGGFPVNYAPYEVGLGPYDLPKEN